MKATLNHNAQIILDIVQASQRHPTALEVYEVLMAKKSRIGMASVYRILHHLVEQGYLKALWHSDESCHYDAHIERHDHAICTICGALFDIPIEVNIPHNLLQAAAEATGIELHSHELRLYGSCSACHVCEA